MASIDADMDKRQLQNRGSYAITQPGRSRSLITQTSTVLLHPALFFRTLPALEYTRQWLWIGLIILMLMGISAVRQASLSESDTPTAPIPADFGEVPLDPRMGGGGGDFSVLLSGGGPPLDGAGPIDGGGSGPNVTGTWTTALIAASGVVLGWGIQTVLLCEVSLLRGFAPRLGRNLQIAIWSTVPLGLMAALQLLYYAAGGSGGQAGVSGLLAEWPGYAELPAFTQAILLSLTSQLTLFWLWSLALIYIGARRALGGRWWSSLLVVIAWAVVVVVLPVISGEIQAPEAEMIVEDTIEPLPNDLGLPFDEAPEEESFDRGLSEEPLDSEAEDSAAPAQSVPVPPRKG